MKKIVVTGATSMIGVALIEVCLKHNIEVHAIIRPGTNRLDRIIKGLTKKSFFSKIFENNILKFK